MDRNTALTSLRPTIKSIEHKADTLPDEVFQNTTLRPILKLQHDIILTLFQINLGKNKTIYHSLKKEEKEEFLTKMIQKQVPFRNQLIGSVLGLFTSTEMEEYQKKTSEINKRILTMAKQRILSV